MKKKLLLVLYLFCLGSVNCIAQPSKIDPTVLTDDITRNASAVVVDYSCEYVFRSPSLAIEKTKIVIAVMNQEGRIYADFVSYGNMYRSLRSFSGAVYNSSGSVITKVRQADLHKSSYFEGLASDTKIYSYEPAPMTYPYFVAYESEAQYSGAILNFSTFRPVLGYGLSVLNSRYDLVVPPGFKFYYRSVNGDIEPSKSIEKGDVERYSWVVNRFGALKYQPYSVPAYDRFPIVYLSPREFVWGRTGGVSDSWATYAKWQWGLLKGRDVLPDELRTKVHQLTDNLLDKRSKVKCLYEYLGASTRYVSIQIGIGGLMPMSAAEVYANKFGDCKALSNYMMAMLAECGIDSHYTEIGVGDKKLIADYVNPTLTNHAILQVPLDDEILWLECTNPTAAPLGYIHEAIAGRNALVYKDDSAVVMPVGRYEDSLHRSVLSARIDMSSDYASTAKVSLTNSLSMFENTMFLSSADAAERKRYLSGQINGLAQFTLSDLSYSEYREANPQNTISYSLNYPASISASRIFVNVFPFRSYKFTKPSRRGDAEIYLGRGYSLCDSVEINLPSGIEIESLSAPVEFSAPCGSYRMVVNLLGDGRLKAYRELIVRAGRYPAQMYDDFMKFVTGVVFTNQARVVLKVR